METNSFFALIKIHLPDHESYLVVKNVKNYFLLEVNFKNLVTEMLLYGWIGKGGLINWTHVNNSRSSVTFKHTWLEPCKNSFVALEQPISILSSNIDWTHRRENVDWMVRKGSKDKFKQGVLSTQYWRIFSKPTKHYLLKLWICSVL